MHLYQSEISKKNLSSITSFLFYSNTHPAQKKYIKHAGKFDRISFLFTCTICENFEWERQNEGEEIVIVPIKLTSVFPASKLNVDGVALNENGCDEF